MVRADVSRSLKPLSQLGKRKKSPKGTVVVQAFKGRLRLCWSYQSKRYFLYLELPEGKTNRTVAEGKAKQIESDITTGNFDRTLMRELPPLLAKERGFNKVQFFLWGRSMERPHRKKGNVSS